ncbi:MAG: CDP-alcohol phosphatidyltransferase family protein, partial [Pseudomonadota bacterium]
HLLPALLILLRETLVSGLRESASAMGGLPVSFLAKIKTTAQFVAFILLCAGPSLAGLSLLWVAAALTVITGAQYAIRWWTSQSSTT